MSSTDICVPKIITTSSGDNNHNNRNHNHNNNSNNNNNNNSSNHNNNNNNDDDDASNLGLPKKKWVVSSLSSLNEVADYDDDDDDDDNHNHNHNDYADGGVDDALRALRERVAAREAGGLAEDGDGDDGDGDDGDDGDGFGSTEHVRRAMSPPPPLLRRDSADVVVKEAKQKQRRKSWHVGKFEKKRRKGSLFSTLPFGSKESSGSTSPTALYEKHKRNSWWNVFVPDHWPRSRRQSTDINRSTEKIPFFRGKSRSVDHGITSSSFDLNSLRSKVEGRFESVDRLHKDADGDSRSGSKEKLNDRKMQKPPPTRTISYKVEPTDTLTSVAARFDTTPSELAILNRLPSRTVFPGQIIYVPDKKRLSVDTECSQINSENTERCSIADEGSGSESGSTSRRLSGSDHKDDVNVKDGHAERVHSPTPAVTQPKPVRTFERFLKINVRHITDGQGVVSGVLLVTPNAVMFDPNVSDQLVIEHGPESYGVIAPMEFVVNAAIYHDIAHMRVAHTPQNSSDSGGKPEIYHASEQQRRDSLYRPKEDGDQREETVGETEEADNAEHIVTNQTDSLDSTTLDIQSSPGGKADSLLAKDDTFPELRSSTEEEDNGSICSCDEERPGNAFPKAFDSDLIVKKSNHLLKRSDEFSEKEDSHSGDERRTESPASLPPDNEENASETNLPHLVEAEAVIKHLEERRQSSLDQHWAVPNKIRSLENECPAAEDEIENERSENQSGRLIKQSCHDSGIDIRDPSLVGASRKTTYSDAEILLSDGAEFVPPKPLRPLSQGDDESSPSTKKSTSVSFSLDDSKESSLDNSSSKPSLSTTDDADKQSADSKKSKMMKRLSYPLAWMENIAGEKDDKESSLPSSAESSHPSHSSSVFSKVFSSSPINTLTDFSTGLFLTKTPSEESSNKFQFPPSGILSTNSSSQPNLEPSAQHLHQQQHHHHHRHHRCATISSSSVLSSQPKKEGFASSIISNVGRSSVSSFIRQQHHNRSDSTKSAGPRLDYRSMVSVEDMPELFVSFDKLIPRPARSCEDPPLYLRLRMGKPLNRRIPKTTPIMSYGKKKMRPEYWFSVPRNRVDDLYKFLNIWVPHLYGDLDEDVVTDRGYELVNSDTELWDDDDANGEDEKKMHRRGSEGDSSRDSWEVLSMSEELRRALYSSVTSLDLELFLPDLNGKTEILTEEHRRQLCRHLPARAEGYSWTLVFSTSLHGYSLNFMYRKMNRIDSPILMVIQDTESNVFGVLTSCTLRVSDHFYGTGESLLFTFTPEFQVYNWTGENLYFIKGNNESLSIGAGDGKFGIWLDGDLYQGRTQPCNTYGNEPLVPGQDFIIKTLECWAFL